MDCLGLEDLGSYVKPGGESLARATLWVSGYTQFSDNQLDQLTTTASKNDFSVEVNDPYIRKEFCNAVKQ
jgi:hypothetical protein